MREPPRTVRTRNAGFETSCVRSGGVALRHLAPSSGLRYHRAAHVVTQWRGASIVQRAALPCGSPQAGYREAAPLPVARAPPSPRTVIRTEGAPGAEGQTCGVTGDSGLAAPRGVAIDQAGGVHQRRTPTPAAHRHKATTSRETALNRRTGNCEAETDHLWDWKRACGILSAPYHVKVGRRRTSPA